MFQLYHRENDNVRNVWSSYRLFSVLGIEFRVLCVLQCQPQLQIFAFVDVKLEN